MKAGTGTLGTAHALRLESVRKVYGSGANAVTALDGVTVGLRRGGFTAVMGPSGSGKSTFLHCAAGLDRPTSGRVLLGDTDLAGMSENELTGLRRQRIGFVFQAYNLIPSLTVEQNITLPLRFAGVRPDAGWLREIVERVGIANRLAHRPAELSGGQQQRVAIARALVTRPEVLLADEPTGALDTRTGRQVLELLRGLVDSVGQTVLMVTHDPVAASYAHSVLFLADGRFAGELHDPTADAVSRRLAGLGEW
ncbi:ABC transporter ATP-binding protein [Saccharothrix algeriensis]|uniref:ABC transport system ATP-binding protein n=1 Tax=Saccharothrix algeriensis TaxID=173560 RepID=A0A8T8HUZ4_9PSEU|nr:ABC transporter ATP-binding protein [Saccharothrix algeriensis]MBM7813714.1 putative ABC transport system ATP-binding protein [Saccharothrix algeriensis]QTR02179.1 ABC transporter ATP-binding protein [Saccharothrix algeriensis]